MKWIKIMCNILDHPKIKMIRQEQDGDTFFLLWILMIIEAGKCEQRGYLKISKNVPYTDKTLSMMTGISLSTVQRGLNLFISYAMIEQKHGAFFIRNWRNYQSEDKLASRRKNDRDRQRKRRKGIRNQLETNDKKKASRDSHVTVSRDVTLENRQEENRIDKKTTTDRVCLLLAETPFVKISHKELQALEKRHGLECLLQAADIAAETWRRNPEERHNPGGYLNTLCSSLVIPEWYVPFSERKKAANRSPRRKEIVEAEKATLVAQEEAERAAAEEVWSALSDNQRNDFIEKARESMPVGINPSKTVLEIVARDLAGKPALSSHPD